MLFRYFIIFAVLNSNSSINEENHLLKAYRGCFSLKISKRQSVYLSKSLFFSLLFIEE